MVMILPHTPAHFYRLLPVLVLVLLLFGLYRYSIIHKRWSFWRVGYESAGHLTALPGQWTGRGELPTILIYSPSQGSYNAWRGTFPGPVLSCRDVRCHVTSDQAHLQQEYQPITVIIKCPLASAVVVALGDVNRFTWTWMPVNNPGRANQVVSGEPSSRGRPDDLCCANISGSEPLKSQVWAAVWREAPGYYHRGTTFSTPAHLAALDNVFNYTVNYRRDADISFTYFEQSSHQCRWKEVEGSSSPVGKELLSSKSDLVLWISSHCSTNSKREEYIAELNKHVPVTSLGSCGVGLDSHAWKNVGWHKFYLSMENSLCDDYITEKFFTVLLEHNTVPIVMGPPKQSYERMAPPNSYIHIQDFPTAKDLAKYLLYLDSHPEEYLKYLAWKGRYKAECVESWGCDLCREVSKVQGPRRREITSFLDMWTNSTCYSDWTYQERSEQ